MEIEEDPITTFEPGEPANAPKQLLVDRAYDGLRTGSECAECQTPESRWYMSMCSPSDLWYCLSALIVTCIGVSQWPPVAFWLSRHRLQ